MTGLDPIQERAHEVLVMELIKEKDVEIARLATRVDQLMADRQPVEAVRLSQERIMRVEFALFGPRGDNGLVSAVKTVEKALTDMRDKELAEVKQMLVSARLSIGRWVLGLLPIVTMISVGAAEIVSRAH